jgi:hypothetical protein
MANNEFPSDYLAAREKAKQQASIDAHIRNFKARLESLKGVKSDIEDPTHVPPTHNIINSVLMNRLKKLRLGENTKTNEDPKPHFGGRKKRMTRRQKLKARKMSRRMRART